MRDLGEYVANYQEKHGAPPTMAILKDTKGMPIKRPGGISDLQNRDALIINSERRIPLYRPEEFSDRVQDTIETVSSGIEKSLVLGIKTFRNSDHKLEAYNLEE